MFDDDLFLPDEPDFEAGEYELDRRHSKLRPISGPSAEEARRNMIDRYNHGDRARTVNPHSGKKIDPLNLQKG